MDIVERLRQRGQAPVQALEAMNEAADEIERLRSELLAQTEAEQERAKVVAWLRADALRVATTFTSPEFSHAHLANVQARATLAERIEKGEHLREGRK